MQVGESGQIEGISAPSITRAFLTTQGLIPGVPVTMLAKGQRGEILLQVGKEPCLHLSEKIAQAITFSGIPTSPIYVQP